MFLSGDLIAELGSEWINPFDPEHVDGAAYTLRIGDEAFVSPEGRDTRKPGLTPRLQRGDPIVIPPGQFAYLTTREFVTLPHDILGFINMKSTLKNSGLVNVSGFHVDPGYKGKLLFAIFNAGPQTITVRCDQDAFLIWFARLDGATEKYSRKKPGFKAIDTTLMGLLPAETASLNSISKRMEQIERRISYALGALKAAGGIAAAAIAGIIASIIYKALGGP
jgi:dCTP deaminase